MFQSGLGVGKKAWGAYCRGLGTPLFWIPWDNVTKPLQALLDPWGSH